MKKIYLSVLHYFAILILTSILLLLPALAQAEDSVSVSYNNSAKTITITAAVSDKADAAVMIKVSKDSQNSFVNFIRTAENGVVTHTETMPSSFSGGRYDVTVSSVDKVLTGYFIYPVDSTIVS